MDEENVIMNNQVYLVFFNTGKYEDKFSCVEKAFFNEGDAQRYAEEWNNKLIQDKLHNSNYNCSEYNFDNYDRDLLKYGYAIDYTGARYTVQGPIIVE